jgi:surfactin family lipopeptide synthetase C
MLKSSLIKNLPCKIHHIFETQSKVSPQKIAIVFHQQKLTYDELNAKANQFARYLIRHHIKPGDIIPIISSKSPQFLMIILGILKAGAAYSPLNVDSPTKHIETVIKETRAKSICVESNLLDRLTLEDNTLVIKLDDLDEQISLYNEKDIENSLAEPDLAYIIYTSGTTGNPKGGMIAHANLLPTYYSWKEAYNLSETDIHLQMAPVGFDVFTGDWVRALCSGGTLVLCPKTILTDSEKLYQLIGQEKINCAEFVPAILRQLTNFVKEKNYDLSQFRLLICGSDQWTMGEYRSVKRLCGKGSRVISSYGLTETTIDSSFYEETPREPPLDDKSIVPIGKPFKHVNIYLANSNKLTVPGEIGEIYIGGLGVGLGYLNQPRLTADKFVDGIVLNGIREKLYRTGDQGRVLLDGNFLFLGRNQEHIKIYGNLVDLPSLEAIINQHQKIKYAIVTPANKVGSDEVILKCFFTLNDNSLTFEELTEHIKNELPYYYIPKEFYQVEIISVSLNGKVDKRVNSQKVIKELRPKFNPPQDKIQQYLVDLWKGILDIDELGINNNFYTLGGSSLLFVVMLERVNKRFNLDIQPIVKFETIEELSNHIENKQLFSLKQQFHFVSYYKGIHFYTSHNPMSIFSPITLSLLDKAKRIPFLKIQRRSTSVFFQAPKLSSSNLFGISKALLLPTFGRRGR